MCRKLRHFNEMRAIRGSSSCQLYQHTHCEAKGVDRGGASDG